MKGHGTLTHVHVARTSTSGALRRSSSWFASTSLASSASALFRETDFLGDAHHGFHEADLQVEHQVRSSLRTTLFLAHSTHSEEIVEVPKDVVEIAFAEEV